MRYEDLFKARMVRDTKDKAAVDKGTGKHGPKRQSYTQDEEEETVEAVSREVVSRQESSSVPRIKMARGKNNV
jgi:hypothetical protein